MKAPKQRNFELELLLTKIVIVRDADALHSLIENKASAENFEKEVKRIYPKVAAILAPEEQEWLRLQLGGGEEKPFKADEVQCTRLVSILEIANLLEFPYWEFRQFLLESKYKVYALKKGDRVVAEGISFAVLAIACLDFVVFWVRVRAFENYPFR